MTNFDWLNINNLYDEFIKDYGELGWYTFINKYRIHYNPKCDTNEVLIIFRWLRSNHMVVKKCVDIEPLLEYIKRNDTSNNEQYYRIRIDDFLKFIDMLDVHEIEV